MAPLCGNGRIRPSSELEIGLVRASVEFAQGGLNQPRTSEVTMGGMTMPTIAKHVCGSSQNLVMALRLDFMPPNKTMPSVPERPRGVSCNSPHRKNGA